MHYTDISNHRFFKPTLIGVGSFLAGVGVGYVFGKRKSNVLVVESIDVMNDVEEKNDEMQTTVSGSLVSVEDYVKESLTKEEDELFVVNPEPIKDVVKNIFDNVVPSDDWDYELEMQNRSKDAPYVIHQDEFIADEMGYRQETVTYYVGDDIMADAMDTPIYNYAGLMGELKFGHGTNDKNVVYIRNEAIRMEWEVLRHQGSFTVEVLGFELEREAEEMEIKHSSVPKFRNE